MTDQTLDRDALLAAFADALKQADGDYNLLRTWRKNYPAHAEDFMQFVLDQLAFGNQESDEKIPDGETAGKTVAAGRRALEKLRPRPALIHLYGPQTGWTPQRLAQTLRLPVSIIAKLEGRMLDAATLPKRLVVELAQILGRTTDDVALFLRQTPRLSANAMYRSQVTPKVQPLQTFDAAFVRAAPDERAAWGDEVARGERLGPP